MAKNESLKRITFTDKAKQKILAYIEASDSKNPLVLRILIAGRNLDDYNYQFGLDEEKNKGPEDVTIDLGGFAAIVDPDTAEKMEGSTVDWVENLQGSGFQVENPKRPKRNLDDPKAKKVQELLDNEINPGVASHGGFVELINVEDDRVYLKMGGGCQGCGMVDATLKQGIEVRIKEQIPEIKEVIDITDHASGSNPYYQGS